MPNIPRLNLGQRLAIRGGSHRLSADALFRQSPANAFNGPFSASIWLLNGFAIELAFKSILFTYGFDEKRLKAIGHDLTHLLKAYVEVEGPAPELLEHAVMHMAPTHKDNFFRYGGADDVDLPQLPVVLAASETLVRRAFKLNGLEPKPQG